MTVTGKAPEGRRSLPPRLPTGPERSVAALGYLSGLILGPVVPLIVYLAWKQSMFVRWHATQALNATLTWLLYLVCGAIVGGLLALDNWTLAFGVMVPAAAALWVIMLQYLARAAGAARKGGFRQIPAWICSPLVK